MLEVPLMAIIIVGPHPNNWQHDRPTN